MTREEALEILRDIQKNPQKTTHLERCALTIAIETLKERLEEDEKEGEAE